MVLASWELIIYQLSLGSLVSGFLLFPFSILTSGVHFGHVNHGVHFGHFGNFGHFIHTGHFHFGHHSHINLKQQAKANQNPSAPIMLILSALLLMFGAIGTVIYKLELFDPLLRILLVIAIPLVFVKVVMMAWNKVVENDHGNNIPIVAIDNQVTTLTNVDELGGLVLADTGDLNQPETLHSNEKMKMQAKTLPGISIERDTVAYIIDIDQKNTLIIDLWPKQTDKKGKMPTNIN